MLADRYANDNLLHVLLPLEDYRPYPPADDRAAWAGLPRSLCERLVAAGERYLGYEWPSLPATAFMAYFRTGNRSDYEKLSFERRNVLADLVLAECVEGSGRFIDTIVNGIWHICEESFWGVPAHNYHTGAPGPLPDLDFPPVIDLFAGETAGLLAWTSYLLATRLDQVGAAVRRRIYREVKWRILDPYLERDDYRWMGLVPGWQLNNWNPWCNANCLTAFLLLEPDNDRRTRAVAKAMRSLDAYLDTYHHDGGCDEGPGYWRHSGASLFDCLEQLFAASQGAINVYSEPLVAEIGRYIYRMHLGGDYFVNFADGHARLSIPADLVYRYGCRIGDTRLAAFGLAMHHADSTGGSSSLGGPLVRRLPAIFNWRALSTQKAEPPFVRDVWLSGLEVMVAREREGSAEGLCVAAKGGHNGENHNHNDVGSFIVYLDGAPVLVDVGVETYTAKTFSPQRYEIWTMQSAYHNVPHVRGVGQEAGADHRATETVYRVEDNAAELSMEIAGAYPAAAGIATWRRSIQLRRGDKARVVVTDRFRLHSSTEDVELHLLTPCAPDVSVPGVVALGEARLTYDAALLSPQYEVLAIADTQLRSNWGERLFRLILRAKAPVADGCWQVVIEKA